MQVEIIDIGIGNVASVKRMYDRLGVEARVVQHPSDLSKGSNIILPGVGNFKAAMDLMSEGDFISQLRDLVFGEFRPILGICLGMQLMFTYSEEGSCAGLGFIDGTVKKFDCENSSIRIPHMGWNSVDFKTNRFLGLDLSETQRYYFVHSYYVSCNDDRDVVGTTHYGNPFCSIVNKGNIYGVQFHPEKSHRFGMKVLKGFAEL